MPAAAPVLMMIAKGVASMLVSSILSRFFTSKKPPSDINADVKNAGFQVNTQSSKAHLPLIYGSSRVGINRVFVEATGSDNEYIHIIGTLGEGEIEGFSEQVSGVDPVYLNNKLWNAYGTGNVHFELFTGSPTQTVCATLNTAIPRWTDPLRNTAYIYVRLKFDRDKFQGVPDITVGIKGLKLYNPTTTLTAYSTNPALAVYDMISRPPYRGGFGLSRSRINTASTEAALQYCSDYGWTCNMPVGENSAVADNIQLLLNNFRGELLSSENEYHIKFRDLNEEVVVESFLDTNDRDFIAGTLKISDPDIFTSYTAVRVSYFAEEGAADGTSTYKEKSFVVAIPGLVEGDGTYNEFSVKCQGLSDLDSVQKMANYYLERFQLNKTCSFVAGQKASRLEPMDLIALTHTMPGWAAKTFRVISASLNPDYTVNLECVEEDIAFYDGVYDPAVLTWNDTNLVDITAGPQSVVGVSLAEEVYYYRNRSFTRLKCNFSPPLASIDPFWDYAEVYVKIGAGDYKYMTRSGGDYQLDPVEEGETYYIKLRSVNIQGVREADDDAYVASKTIDGKSTLPTSLSAMTAVANGDSVSIFANPITDPDTEGYEVRLGDAWDGAVFISFNKNCSLRLNGVRPGTHTFWMSPKDNAGNYSETPVSATVLVFVPPGYTQLPTYGSWAWDFVAGTHDNTEHVTYDTHDAVKCSHTANVLSGTFTSPTFDLNAVKMVRIWGDFRTAFVSSTTTWEGVMPAGVTWADFGDKTWAEIFEPSQAGQIDAVLKYSTDNTNWSSIGFFQVLCAEVYARYIKVEVTITDPTLDSTLYLYELNMLAYEGPQ